MTCLSVCTSMACDPDSYPHSVRDSPLSMSSPSLRILVRLATMPLSPIVGQWGPHPLLSLPSQQPHPRWNQTASPKNYDYDSRWVQM